MGCNLSYEAFFQKVTKFQPFPFQLRFAERDKEKSIFCEIPTGLGKTYMVLIDWLWGRKLQDESTPRRLVFVLPLRTLVEQVSNDVRKALEKAEEAGIIERKIAVYMLMGGAVELNFDEDPTKESILIGTLDQILSRQLMRAYSCNRARFPKQFAYLHNDCRIVCDETQLMGVGFLTSGVLQDLRDKKGVFGKSQTIWMSATLDRSLLNDHDLFNDAPILSLEDEDWENKKLIKRLGRTKELRKAQTVWKGYKANGIKTFTQSLLQEVLAAHQPETLTLLILNTTAKAIELYRLLVEASPDQQIELLHSRFRPPDRADRVNAITDKTFKGIIVSTQCVEAGVDLDARVLFTELAPWASLVQRFGRCGRRGVYPEAQIYWIDAEVENEKDLRPYGKEELNTSRTLITQLPGAGIQELLKIKPPKQLAIVSKLREKTLKEELFDTTLQKDGTDKDIAEYVRETDKLDVSLAWREWEGHTPPSKSDIHRDELCNVSPQQFIRSEIQQCWIWSELENKWQIKTPKECKSGQTVLIQCAAGGYSKTIGWTGRAGDIPNPIIVPELKRETNSTDYQSFNKEWTTLRQHSLDAAKAMEELLAQLQDLNLSSFQSLLIRTAQWHDFGKAHPVFQETMKKKECPDAKELWAKSPHGGRHSRKGFRHELVSALAALQHGEHWLLAYLVACHHGKVRGSISRLSWEEQIDDIQSARGVREGDTLPAVVDLGLESPISVRVVEFPPPKGRTKDGKCSWEEIVRSLRDNLGVFRLSFLETLVRNADELASSWTKEIHFFIQNTKNRNLKTMHLLKLIPQQLVTLLI